MAELAKLAYLVKPGEFEFREYPIPEIDDDQILIKVEGCGVCGTDGHEYKRDPFNLCPVVLGHEGSADLAKWLAQNPAAYVAFDAALRKAGLPTDL